MIQNTVDSTHATRQHIANVCSLLNQIIYVLNDRGKKHDASKLELPEKEILDVFTWKLRGLTYGSDEYKVCLAAMCPMLEHHYAENSHHPEHYPNGVAGMDLLDVVEMLADWKAATLRHTNGDIGKSLEINRERFALSEQLYEILLNTAKRMNWLGNSSEEREILHDD